MSAKKDNTERGFPVALSWILFLVMVIVGAGLITSPHPSRQILGFVLLFAPLVLFSLIMALFYYRSRRDAERLLAAEEPESPHQDEP